MSEALAAPMGLLAELTHRCPLACPYCSNPLALDPISNELSTAEWARVFAEAAELGVLQTHLSGGEPGSRRDLMEIAAAAHEAGLYTNLITSSVGLDAARLARLRDAGLDHVQVSIQDVEPASGDRIAGYQGAHVRKLAFAREVVDAGLALTINAVVHRANIANISRMVELAFSLGAGRVEIAHAQYYGWGLRNRAALMPTRAQVKQAVVDLDACRRDYAGRISIDAVVPDYYARRPKACMGGWGSRSLNVTPTGKVLPCHAAESIAGLEFWNARDHSLADIWRNSPAFNAYRGEEWMQEPCRSCDRRHVDFGGCRCQAMALLGDAAATDPVCELSPHHVLVATLADASSQAIGEDILPAYAYRARPPRAALATAETVTPIPVR